MVNRIYDRIYTNPKQYTADKLAMIFTRLSGSVKLFCGASANAAYYVVLDALDKVKASSLYRHDTKKLFNSFLPEWRRWEFNLLHCPDYPFFSVCHVTKEGKMCFGNITNEQYFELWQSIGEQLYAQTFPLVQSLFNVYRQTIHVKMKDEDMDALAWVYTADAVLQIAAYSWRCQMDIFINHEDFLLPPDYTHLFFRAFNLSKVADVWRRAMLHVCKGHSENPLERQEEHDLEATLSVLRDAWTSPDEINRAARDAAGYYREYFTSQEELEKFQKRFS